MASMIDLDYDWEAERKARIAHRRRLWFAKWLWTVVWAVMIVVFIVSIASIVWSVITLERNERASYNEGRYGVSREVALKLADQGVGMCARELIEDYSAARSGVRALPADGRACRSATAVHGKEVMLIEDAIRSAEETRATVTAQEFRGYKFAKVSTLTVKRLCKWVIDMGQQVVAMRQKVFELEKELDAVKTPGRESTARTDGEVR